MQFLPFVHPLKFIIRYARTFEFEDPVH
jgi:hypothetical protein